MLSQGVVVRLDGMGVKEWLKDNCVSESEHV